MITQLNKKTMKEFKSLIDKSRKLITEMDQYSFFSEGYANGSASISEVMNAGEMLAKAKSELFDLLKKLNECDGGHCDNGTGYCMFCEKKLM